MWRGSRYRFLAVVLLLSLHLIVTLNFFFFNLHLLSDLAFADCARSLVDLEPC